MAREGVKCVLKGLEEGFGGGARILSSSWEDGGDGEGCGWGCG